MPKAFSHFKGEQTLLWVFNDFGRKAAIKFCAQFSDMERYFLQQYLSDENEFYDEYRHAALHLAGDLSFLKANTLSFRKPPLDRSIMVNFPGGMKIKALMPQLSFMMLQAINISLERNIKRIIFSFPCNTMSPALWGLKNLSSQPDELQLLLEEHDLMKPTLEPAMLALKSETLKLEFPSVPEAVIQFLIDEGYKQMLPLGTPGITKTYKKAANRIKGKMGIRELGPGEEQSVLNAIQASISGDQKYRQSAKEKLFRLVENFENEKQLAIVEACTDLDYRLGLNSNEIYAKEILRQVYSYYGMV